MRVRYPRTPHLPWSPGASADDVRAADPSGLLGEEVVVTEKLDGENTTLYRDGLHARSLDSAHHPSRAWLKALHARVAGRIPPGFRVSGENVHARHAIAYEGLDSFFYAFSVWDPSDRCLDWDATERFARHLGVPTPRVLWRGAMDERALRALRVETTREEGYVVRVARGFPREEFALRVAKWVRAGHVQTDEHWMLAPVVPNGLGPRACLWDVRAGAAPDVPALLRALGLEADGDDGAHAAALDAAARGAGLGRCGDELLGGVLAALLHRRPRARLLTELPASLGARGARRVGDLAGLHARLLRPFPDERRGRGLRRLALAVDVGLLHAVAGATLAGRTDAEAREAREQLAWSELFAGEEGLLEDPTAGPLARVRRALEASLAGLGDRDVLERCFGEAAERWVEGRARSPEEAEAATWRHRDGRFARLTITVGPSGSGKSRLAERRRREGARVISLDERRAARGDRADRSADPELLAEALAELDARLAAGERVVWDATSLTAQQRALPLATARRRDAMATLAVFLVPERVLRERNARREHAVPEAVLAAQLERFAPPLPGDAHRVVDVDADGAELACEGGFAAPPAPRS